MNSIVIIILGIIVIILLFALYVYFTSSVSPLIKYVNLNDTSSPSSIPYSSITNPLSTRFAYSVWIYVNTWKTLSTTKTNVFYRNNEVGISFDETRPILYCNFNNNDGGLHEIKTPPIPEKTTTTIIVSNNFPIQTWTNVILNIDNNYLDVYINGQLVRSNVLSTQYTQPEVPNDIKIGDSNGSDIYLANLKRWGGSINPQTAYYDYLSGLQQLPAESSTYNFKLSLLKDNNLLQSLKL